jgi:hypothetical protein
MTHERYKRVTLKYLLVFYFSHFHFLPKKDKKIIFKLPKDLRGYFFACMLRNTRSNLMHAYNIPLEVMTKFKISMFLNRQINLKCMFIEKNCLLNNSDYYFNRAVQV